MGHRFRLVNSFRFFLTVVTLTAVWCLWNESLSARTLLEGVILGSASLWVTNRYLLKRSYQNLYRINVLSLIRYVAVVIVQIFRSGFDAIRITLSGKVSPAIVEVRTDVTDPFATALIGNAITMTPGTVTLDYKDGVYTVIWINCPTDDPEQAGEQIKGSFERALSVRTARAEGR